MTTTTEKTRAAMRRRMMARAPEARGKGNVGALRARFEECVVGATFRATLGPRPYDVTIDGKHVVAKATLTAWEVHGWAWRLAAGEWGADR